MGATRWAAALLFTVLGATPGLGAQEATPEAGYFRAVAEFFEVSASEIEILRDWELAADEIPVVLFVAHRAGVSPEALVALRRTGRPWTELTARYGVGADAIYVPIPDQAPAGRLEAAYESFRGTPATQWGSLRLSDQDIIALVNVRMLSETLGITPSELLRRAGPSGAFSSRYNDLLR